MTETINDRLIRLGACQEARQWAAQYTDPQQAWDACERGSDSKDEVVETAMRGR